MFHEPSDFEFDGGKRENDENLFGDGEIPTPTKDDFHFGGDEGTEDLFSPSPNASAEPAEVSSPRRQDDLFLVSPAKSDHISETDNFQQAHASDSADAFENSADEAPVIKIFFSATIRDWRVWLQ